MDQPGHTEHRPERGLPGLRKGAATGVDGVTWGMANVSTSAYVTWVDRLHGVDIIRSR
jgi:hypothetical protein